MKFKAAVLGSTGLALTCIAMPMAAHAQDAQTSTEASPDEGDIVVTAQRRSQNLQDVPVSVAAISGAQLRSQGVASIVDVGRMVPGVMVASNTGGQAAAFSIRGVTLSDFSDLQEAPVAVYVDETYLPNVQAQSSAMFDLDHVEILKGPQGTLFGRNSTGGLVNLIVAKPTEETEGFVNAIYGRFNKAKIEGALGGTIAGNVQGRISLLMDRADGWLRNDFRGQPDLGGQSTFAGRLQLQSEILPGLTARLSGSYFHQDMSSAPYTTVATTAIRDSANRVVGGIFNTTGPDGLGYASPPLGTRSTNSDYACNDCTGMRSGDVALHLNYDAGSFEVFSTTNYYRIVKHLKLDGDSGPLNFLDVSTNGTTSSFSQELRATGKTDTLVWNAGVYYLDIVVDGYNGYVLRPGSIYAQRFYPTYATSGLNLTNITRLHKQTGSIFGQVEYEFVPSLTLTVGGRLIREWQDYDFQSNGYTNPDNFDLNTNPNDFLFVAQPAYVGKQAKTMWSGKVGLSYKPTDDLLLYTSVNRGVRGPGYNNKLAGGAPLAANQIPYKAETLMSYEVGVKSTLLDGALLIDAAAYHYDYKNYQAFLFQTAGGFIMNADATTDGAEIGITLKPVHGLELQASGSYNKSTVKDLAIAPGVNRDVRPTFAPKRQLSASASYTLPNPVADGALSFSANVQSVSSFFTNIRNFDSQHLSGYTVAGGQIAWKNDSGVSLTVSVTNIFDKVYALNQADLSTLCGCTEIGYGRPREYALTLGYRF